MSPDVHHPPVTIALCTHGARPRRAATLAAARSQAGPGDEVLVVVNGRWPPSLIGELAASPGVAVAVEPVEGVGPARAAALRHAAHEVVLFLDDDVVPEPGWRDALAGAVLRPGVGAAGGVIVLEWAEGTRPPWLDPRLEVLFGERAATSGRPPFGANFAVRVAVAATVGGFDVALGRRPGGGVLHEETDLCERIATAGHAVVDVPGAVVRHPAGVGGITGRSVLALAATEGRSDAVRDRRRGGGDPALRLAKAAGLLAAAPVLAILPRRRSYYAARLAVNLAYLRAWRRGDQ